MSHLTCDWCDHTNQCIKCEPLPRPGSDLHDPRPLGGRPVSVEHGGLGPLGVVEQEGRGELRSPAKSAFVHPGPDGAFGVVELNGVGGHTTILPNGVSANSGRVGADLGFSGRHCQETAGRDFGLTRFPVGDAGAHDASSDAVGQAPVLDPSTPQEPRG
jgi:hypothetical protein